MAPKAFKRFMNAIRRVNHDDLDSQVDVLASRSAGSSSDPYHRKDDETSSVWSLETMDNNPGAGRTLDNIFFRPLGLGLEKLLNRVLGPHLVSRFAVGRHLLTKLTDFQMPFVTMSQRSMREDELDDGIVLYTESLEYKFDATVYAGVRRLLMDCMSSQRSKKSQALSQILLLSSHSSSLSRLFVFLAAKKGFLEETSTVRGSILPHMEALARTFYRIEPAGWTNHEETVESLRETLLKIVQDFRSGTCPLFSSTITVLSCASRSTAPFADLLYKFFEKLELMEAARLTLIAFMWIIPLLRANAINPNSAALCDSCIHIMRNLMIHLVRSVHGWPDDTEFFENVQGYQRLLSLFFVPQVSSYFPKASAIAHDTYKGIYTRALKEMPEDVQSNGEGRLLLDEMFADAMEQTKRMLASIKELEEAIQNLHNRPYTYLNWKAIFAKPPSILDRGEHLYIDRLLYPLDTAQDVYERGFREGYLASLRNIRQQAPLETWKQFLDQPTSTSITGLCEGDDSDFEAQRITLERAKRIQRRKEEFVMFSAAMMKWGVQWFVFDDEIHKVPSMAELTERLRQGPIY